jgi:fermentation-respiration switch protein FrsA (DUF1100 family)
MPAASRTDVTFDSLGSLCSGWLYRPVAASDDEALPGIVMAHGFTGVKEMDLDPFASALSVAGMAVLLFDYRGWGTSEGEPRQHADPRAQLDDYQNALSWLAQRSDVDGDRMGAWGSSYSGGHVLHLAAFDRRVKAVVSQVPFIDGWQTAVRALGSEGLSMLTTRLAEERASVYAGAEPTLIPVVAEGERQGAIPETATREHLLSVADEAPSWRNEITLGSLERLIEYAPATAIERISPTPLLMLVAGGDLLTPSDLALDAYNRALAPKEVRVITSDSHHGIYGGSARAAAIEAATDWFTRHLGADRPSTAGAVRERDQVPA